MIVNKIEHNETVKLPKPCQWLKVFNTLLLMTNVPFL